MSKEGVLSFKVKLKRYKRRKPQSKSGHVKWSEDRDDKGYADEEPTSEDQRRVDVAWAVVQDWLKNYDPSKQVRNDSFTPS